MFIVVQMRTTAEVKRILLKPSADRTEQEVYYVSVSVTSMMTEMLINEIFRRLNDSQYMGLFVWTLNPCVNDECQSLTTRLCHTLTLKATNDALYLRETYWPYLVG